ncbi:uncharacterized protein BCR38DRAFT_346844 [Pseudomassariella vexata]|uniref:Large ribosomal subunit protein mL40 n=1 Tax=Pseudomassariella vexata TaxID=1141098 RepID=A0A1Y2DTH1_9PEZI|nr:uncharacterized protein BCR38DRAFT_346844 [Pseudomassariella vexata]ORY62436.1 hypothetical protein BCR38DRAFT_346844 [Pseudomassariella vexata]
MASSIYCLFKRLSISPCPATNAVSCGRAATATTARLGLGVAQSRLFSVSSTSQAKEKSKGKKKKKNKGDEPDPRIRNIKLSISRRVPAPLRFARNRALRHWTIHRAWLLFQRKEREREQRELMRTYQSMSNACEELRTTSGPGTRDEGYLYRVAMEKKGVYGHNSIPIEYARPQTETPAREAWNHGWTRE